MKAVADISFRLRRVHHCAAKALEVFAGQVPKAVRASPEKKKKKSGMGTEDADSDTEDEGDEGNPPADSPVQPASWPFYEQLVFLRDTMTFRE